MATPARNLGIPPELTDQIVSNQNSPAPRPTNSNQAGALPQDTVTLFADTLAQTNSGTENAGAAVANEPVVTAPDRNALTPFNTTNGMGSDANAASGQIANQQATGTTAASSQQEELAQLAILLRQLGINPGSLSSSEQIQLLAYMSDPAALANTVKSLDTIGASAPATTNPQQNQNAAANTAVGALNILA